MAALKPSFHQNHLRLFSPFASVSPVKPFHLRKTTLTKASPLALSFGSALLWSVHRTDGRLSITRFANPGSLVMSTAEASERPPFDLNLAVLLAGFAFEAYSSPPKDVGTREVDAADCQTVFLSE
ncbi:hypothetical protein QJS04_geneDACA000058 [Acorus gramineus]|uniref:Uncharacterized protein n=1 Tax=Acorus gramineus TaxID=55184 RepID=A0AAV9ARI1_ACOGR|nr:hypothetical protein QJS04_geneDACA000058 [Acorus gramineus]